MAGLERVAGRIRPARRQLDNSVLVQRSETNKSSHKTTGVCNVAYCVLVVQRAVSISVDEKQFFLNCIMVALVNFLINER